MVKQVYQSKGVSCEVNHFSSIWPTSTARRTCGGRAGATTVAELTATGKAVIFVPYPFAADNHQVLNARTLTEAGAAEMILQKILPEDLPNESKIMPLIRKHSNGWHRRQNHSASRTRRCNCRGLLSAGNGNGERVLVYAHIRGALDPECVSGREPHGILTEKR